MGVLRIALRASYEVLGGAMSTVLSVVGLSAACSLYVVVLGLVVVDVVVDEVLSVYKCEL